MQDGTKGEAVSWKLSAAFFWCFLVVLNVFVCNMLLTNACKNPWKYVRKTDENDPKWVPKPLQNRSWRGLEASWEPSLKQGASKTSFLTILAPFWDPLWDHLWVILGIVFLMFFCQNSNSTLKPVDSGAQRPVYPLRVGHSGVLFRFRRKRWVFSIFRFYVKVVAKCVDAGFW